MGYAKQFIGPEGTIRTCVRCGKPLKYLETNEHGRSKYSCDTCNIDVFSRDEDAAGTLYEWAGIILPQNLASSTLSSEYAEQVTAIVNTFRWEDVQICLEKKYYAQAIINVQIEIIYLLQQALLRKNEIKSAQESIFVDLFKVVSERRIEEIAQRHKIITKSQMEFLTKKLMPLRNALAHNRFEERELEEKHRLTETINSAKKIIDELKQKQASKTPEKQSVFSTEDGGT